MNQLDRGGESLSMSKYFVLILYLRGSRVRVTSEVVFPDNRGQIIAADIGDAPTRAYSIFSSVATPSTTSSTARTAHFTNNNTLHPSHHIQRTHNYTPTPSSSKHASSYIPPPKPLSNTELKTTLRRLSKMVLAGYGGASLLFFGVPLTATPGGRSIRGTIKGSGQVQTNAKKGKEREEEAELARAVNASEAEAAGDGWELVDEGDVDIELEEKEYSWWDVLLGRHDLELFEKFAKHDEGKDSGSKGKGKEKKADVVIGREHLMPRFWVLTDHSRGEVVLVLRGMKSLCSAHSNSSPGHRNHVPKRNSCRSHMPDRRV